MTPFGIRKKLKSALKGAMGMEAPSRPARSAPQTPPKAPVSAQMKSQSEVRQPAAPPPEDIEAVPYKESASTGSVAETSTKTEQGPDSSVGNQPTNLSETVLADGMELTTENVQEVLDDYVRPGLQSDGGDISLIKIEDNNIYVQLVGACSTCPSSIATMKMGVEMLLKEEFPSLNEIIDVTALTSEELDALSETA